MAHREESYRRINRNIVECKFKEAVNNVVSDGVVLIETLWNVNKSVNDFRDAGLPVLIETLWNVNNEKAKFALQQDLVLIETLWNVNEDVFVIKSRKIRINRNIVECKYVCRV